MRKKIQTGKIFKDEVGSCSKITQKKGGTISRFLFNVIIYLSNLPLGGHGPYPYTDIFGLAGSGDVSVLHRCRAA